MFGSYGMDGSPPVIITVVLATDGSGEVDLIATREGRVLHGETIRRDGPERLGEAIARIELTLLQLSEQPGGPA